VHGSSMTSGLDRHPAIIGAAGAILKKIATE
jgi:hypothetical protein